MTFSPKVWGDALRRLQNETPDFAFDAWIAPIQAKSAKDPVTGAHRILLGCPNSFHRDRVRLHHLAAIEQAIGDALRADAPGGGDEGSALPIELMTASEWKAVEGHRIEVKAGMLRVGHARAAQAVNGASASSGASRAAAPRSASSEPTE